MCVHKLNISLGLARLVGCVSRSLCGSCALLYRYSLSVGFELVCKRDRRTSETGVNEHIHV